MNKRVHEIAKERGLAPKEVLARLKAAGIDVKASSSSVDEEVARRVLNNGAGAALAADSAQPVPAVAPASPASAPPAGAADDAALAQTSPSAGGQGADVTRSRASARPATRAAGAAS